MSKFHKTQTVGFLKFYKDKTEIVRNPESFTEFLHQFDPDLRSLVCKQENTS